MLFNFKTYKMVNIMKYLASFVFIIFLESRHLADSQSINCNSFTSNTNTLGGIRQSYINLDDCKAGCVANIANSCRFGFDWNPAAALGFRCWFSKTGVTRSAPGITHYNCQRSNNCNQVTYNVNTRGGILQPYTNIDGCKAACLINITSSCRFGFDWNTLAARGSQCWFSSTSIINPANGINHYICTSFTLDKETSASPSQRSNCDMVTRNVNTRGGSPQTYRNLYACKAACLFYFNITCKYGFDWNMRAPVGSQCWFSTNNFKYPANEIDHYMCTAIQKPSTVPSIKDNCDIVTKNINTRGGSQQTYRNLDACKAACLFYIASTCKYGFDWNTLAPVGSQCWFSANNLKYLANGIDHYMCTSNRPITTGISTESTLSKNSTTKLKPTLSVSETSTTNIKSTPSIIALSTISELTSNRPITTGISTESTLSKNSTTKLETTLSVSDTSTTNIKSTPNIISLSTISELTSNRPSTIGISTESTLSKNSTTKPKTTLSVPGASTTNIKSTPSIISLSTLSELTSNRPITTGISTESTLSNISTTKPKTTLSVSGASTTNIKSTPSIISLSTISELTSTLDRPSTTGISTESTLSINSTTKHETTLSVPAK